MNGKKILLAVQDSASRAEMATALGAGGWGHGVAGDAAGVQAALTEGAFEVLIIDAALPGNEQLAMVRRVREAGLEIAIIVATAHPTVAEATTALELQATAYLPMPADPKSLLRHVQRGTEWARTLQTVRAASDRADVFHDTLAALGDAMQQTGPAGLRASAEVMVHLALGNCVASLRDISTTVEAALGRQAKTTPCQLRNCPRGRALAAALEDAVRVLEKTKSAFKSKDLADLRQRLESILQDAR